MRFISRHDGISHCGANNEEVVRGLGTTPRPATFHAHSYTLRALSPPIHLTHKHPTINLLKYLLPKHFNDRSSSALEYITVQLPHSSHPSPSRPRTLFNYFIIISLPPGWFVVFLSRELTVLIAFYSWVSCSSEKEWWTWRNNMFLNIGESFYKL